MNKDGIFALPQTAFLRKVRICCCSESRPISPVSLSWDAFEASVSISFLMTLAKAPFQLELSSKQSLLGWRVDAEPLPLSNASRRAASLARYRE